MKKFIPLLFLIGYTSALLGQTSPKDGIKFFNGSWKELLEEARQKNQMIFVDVYTDWCGPCKYMDKFVFTEQTVADKYNVHFLNYKIDAEKGDGIKIAKKFGVNAYPTFLFLNSNGYLVHKVVGEKEKGPFISNADKALSAAADNNNLDNLETKFNEGNRNPLFLKTYLTRLKEVNMDNSVILDAYFYSLPDTQLQEDNTLLYLAQHVSGTRTTALLYLINHYDKMSTASREKTTDRLFDQLIRNAAGRALKENRLMEYAELYAFGQKLYGLDNNQKSFLNRIDLMYHVLTRNYEGLKKAGYQMARIPSSIPNDLIRTEDKKRYDKIMQPFLSGEKDSTKTPGFEEEKKFLVNLYTREIAEQLYTAAKAFSELPASQEQALKDALRWAKRCNELQPGIPAFTDLVKALDAKK